MSEEEEEPKRIHVWAVFNGDTITKWSCGCISVQPPDWPDGSKQHIQWNSPLGLNCQYHRTLIKNE